MRVKKAFPAIALGVVIAAVIVSVITYGAQVDFAEDGHVCLEKVAAAPAGYYDLILMDILMPGMDGVEATRRIRALADGRKARVPIVAMTANVYEKDRKAAFDAGMNAFAEKPIAVDKLFGVIRQCLAQK